MREESEYLYYVSPLSTCIRCHPRQYNTFRTIRSTDPSPHTGWAIRNLLDGVIQIGVAFKLLGPPPFPDLSTRYTVPSYAPRLRRATA